jgi:uncharacterized membrane protein
MSIQKDLSELVANSLISEEQAQNIEAYYQSHKKSNTHTITMVFAAIGAVLIGLALILILAHNWDNMHRTTKIGVAFFPLVLSQILTGFTLWRKSDQPLWKETSAIFQFFSLGACMALIAQIYNIQDSGGSFFLTWAALSIPLIYILRSSAMSILCILCISYFNMSYWFDGSSNYKDFLYYLYMVAILPHYIYLIKDKASSNITYIHHWVVAASWMICTATMANTVAYTLFLLYLALFTFYYNISKSHYFDKVPVWANAYNILSQAGIFIILIIMSFDNVWEGIFREYNTEKMIFSREFLMTSIYGGLAIFLYFRNQIFKPAHIFDFFLIIAPFALIFYLNEFYPAIFINLLTLALGVTVIVRSVRNESLGFLNFGLLIISILILCRFFDTDMSYLIRGLVFALLGISFFVTNYFMIKKFNKDAQ